MPQIRRILFLLVVILLLITSQQVIYFYIHWDRITELKAESSRFVALIESAMYEAASLDKQLSKEKTQHDQLRVRLPAELNEEQLEQLITAQAAAKHIKILARTTAIYTTPFYREARLNLTIEASEKQRDQFIGHIKKLPRIVTISNTKTSGKKNAHYSLSVYALDSGLSELPLLPRCDERPMGLVIPYFHDRLTLHHNDYHQQCQYVHTYSHFYQNQLHLNALQDENQRLTLAISKIRDN